MKTIFAIALLCLALQSDGCDGAAGDQRDKAVTQAKREADAEDAKPTPTPVVMRKVHAASFPAAEHAEAEK